MRDNYGIHLEIPSQLLLRHAPHEQPSCAHLERHTLERSGNGGGTATHLQGSPCKSEMSSGMICSSRDGDGGSILGTRSGHGICLRLERWRRISCELT